MGRVLIFVLGSVVCAGIIGGIGTLLARPGSIGAVWLGASAAIVVQLVLAVGLFVVAFADRPMLAHGLGVLGRFMALAGIGFIGVPLMDVPAAPLLFTLVAVFFATTLLEPFFLLGRS